MAAPPLTIIEKIWNAHTILERADGDTLLWIDRHYVHEGSNHGFGQVAARKARVARPDLTFGIADHYVPTRQREQRGASAEIRNMIDLLEENTARHGVSLFGLEDARQGIVHVAMPEQGLTLPGLLIVCGDSHTSTHGALGAYAFGIGASEVAHVLMTQTIWQKRPKTLRVSVSGTLPDGVTAKDLALNVIAGLGSGGATGHAIEYAGEAVRALSIEARMTLCNLSIEAGSRLGIVAPDEKTFAYIAGRPFAPRGEMFERAVQEWRNLASHDDAAFDSEIAFEAAAMTPTATWGTSPEQALPIGARLPDPEKIADETKAQAVRAALEYMGLEPNMAMSEIPIDRVFIGSCTNSRIEDLRAAAAVLAGRRAVVPGLVSPGSMLIKQQAEEEGLDRIFVAAGLAWEASGCSMCVGMNGDIVEPGQRCASTSNRNFKGRQGPGARTHLVSPAMAAAAALTGHLTDVRPMLAERKP